MKTPNFPGNANPLDIKALLAKTDFGEDFKQSIMASLHNQFVIHTWAQDFGMLPTDAKGTYYWNPNGSEMIPTSFTRYQKVFDAILVCAKILETRPNETLSTLVDFYAKFNPVNKIARFLHKMQEESKKPDSKSVAVVFRAVSYDFGGNIFTEPPKHFKFQFDIGTDHFRWALSDDFKNIEVFTDKSEGPVKSFPTNKIANEFKALFVKTNAEEFVDFDNL